MTFEESIRLTEEIGESHIDYRGMRMRVIVTPANHEDFKKYLTDYRRGDFSNETAKLYSSNGQFAVCGLWMDGANVLFKELPI